MSQGRDSMFCLFAILILVVIHLYLFAVVWFITKASLGQLCFKSCSMPCHHRGSQRKLFSLGINFGQMNKIAWWLAPLRLLVDEQANNEMLRAVALFLSERHSKQGPHDCRSLSPSFVIVISILFLLPVMLVVIY